MEKVTIVVGNKGSFFSEYCETLKGLGLENITLFEIDDIKTAFEKIDEIKILKDEQEKKEINLIYIGGETRRKNIMYLANYYVPIYLINKIGLRLRKFVYLSSLAALPHKLKGVITPETKGEILQKSIYAKSKNDFDKLIQETLSTEVVVSIIYPASIINPTRETSSIQKINKIFKNYKILRFFKFDGYISFCSRTELYEAINYAIRSNERCYKVVANNVSISNFQRYKCQSSWQISIPNFGWLFLMLKRALPLKIYTLGINLFSRTLYASSVENLKSMSCFDLKIYIEENKIKL
jgi:hypothetical protein